MKTGDRVLLVGGHHGIGAELHAALRFNGYIVDTIGKSTGYDFANMSSQHIMRDVADMARGIDCLVYNSGVNYLCEIGKTSMLAVEELYQINVLGFIAAIEGAVRAGSVKKIVGISSVSSRTPMTHSLPYCSSKAAMTMAARCAARELGPQGITVNTISPGPVDDTEMTDYIKRRVPEMRGMSPEEAEAYQMSAIPLRRRVTKEEVSNVLIYLLSSKASGITGADLVVSGGM